MKEFSEIIFRPLFESIGRACTDALTRRVLAGQVDAVRLENGRLVARYCRRMVMAMGDKNFSVAQIWLL